MPPPPPRKRIKRPAQVLDEDVYSDAVSHIIARDFFPGLLETEAQNEYLSAIQSKDREWIRQAGQKLTAVMTPGSGARRASRGTSFRSSIAPNDTPTTQFGGETPARPESAEPQAPHVDVNMSLGAFQAKYTSEDNESFNELLDKQNDRRSSKYTHFYNGNKIPTARQLEYRAQKASEQSQALVISNSSGEERQLLAPGRPSQNLDDRPAQLDGFRDREGPRNHFMFEPDSIEDQVLTAANAAADASKAPPKVIKYTSTRFRGTEHPDRPPSPTNSSVDGALRRRSTAPLSSADFSGSETPRVNGYAFVDAEPTPSELGIAVADEEADAADRAAFDKLLPKAGDVGQNHFQISQQSRREDIHHKLVEKSDIERRRNAEASRSKRLGMTPTARPGSTPRRSTAQMTPAAKSLAARLSTPRKGWQ